MTKKKFGKIKSNFLFPFHFHFEGELQRLIYKMMLVGCIDIKQFSNNNKLQLIWKQNSGNFSEYPQSLIIIRTRSLVLSNFVVFPKHFITSAVSRHYYNSLHFIQRGGFFFLTYHVLLERWLSFQRVA